MKMLDRYIARLFLINAGTLFVVLFSFVVAVDVVINLRRFSQAGAEQAGADAGAIARGFATIGAIADLWGPRLLQLFSYLSGVILIVAAGFTCAQLVRSRELVAVMASGIGLHRVVRPFVAVALVVTVVQVIDNEVLIPRVAHLLTRDVGQAGERELGELSVRLIEDDRGMLLSAETFDPNAGVLRGVHLFARDADGRLLTHVTGEEAVWDGSVWRLAGGEMQVIGGGGAGGPRTEQVEVLATSLDPETLVIRRMTSLAQNLSWVQISDILQRGGLDERARERLERARWGRIASILSNLLALIAALPLFLVRLPQPMLGPALRSAPIMGLGLGAAAVSTSLSLPGLPVWLGVFVPSLLLAPIAIVMVTGIRS